MIVKLYREQSHTCMFEFSAKAKLSKEKVSFVEYFGSVNEYMDTITENTIENGFFGKTKVDIKEKYISQPIELFKIHMVCGKTIFSDTDPLKDDNEDK